jgi:hypothetical protein
MPQSPCDPVSKKLTELAMMVGAEDGVNTLDDVVAEMQKIVPEYNVTRDSLVASIVEATEGARIAQTELDKKLAALRREARRDVGLRKSINDMQTHLRNQTQPPKRPVVDATPAQIKTLRDELLTLRKQVKDADPARRTAIMDRIGVIQKHIRDGTLPDKSPRPPAPLDDVTALRTVRDALMRELRKTEPAIKERFEKQIEALTDRIENGVVLPNEPAEPELMSKELEKLAFQRDRLRGQINSRIRSMRPRGILGKTQDTINLSRAIKTSFDVSAVLRQGGMITYGHPIKAARAFAPMIRALSSEQKAAKIRKSIEDRENAPYYHRAGLYLSPEEGMSLSAQEEAFMSRWLEQAKDSKVGRVALFPVHASQRAYTTFLDVLRADMFDAMNATLARNGEPTLKEMEANANYINVATGRGKLKGSLEQSATTLNTIFFAPRYLASRFQVLAGQPFYGGNARTRKLIATEYARSLLGIAVVYALGKMAGGELEEDPRSADFGKMRFGDTRLDPLAGLAQVSTFTARMVTGQTKDSYGEVKDIRGDDVKFGKTDALDVLTRFGRSKLAPFPGAVLNVATGKNFAGEKTNIAKEAVGLVTPIGFGDIYEVLQENNVPKGVSMSMLGLFGMGLQHYNREEQAKKRKEQRESGD